MRSELNSSDSDLLINLSKASKQLQVCSSADIKNILCSLQIATRTTADHDNADVSQSNMEDEASSHTNYLVLLLESQNKVVAHAAVKTLLACSDSLRKNKAAAWAPFLLHLWIAAQCWATGPSKDSCGCAQAKVRQMSNTESNRKHQRDQCLIVAGSIDLTLTGGNMSAASNAIDLLQRILKECLKNSDGTLQDLKIFVQLFSKHIIHIATATTKKTPSNCSQCLAKLQMLAEEEFWNTSRGDLPRELLLGSVLRILCTATHVTDSTSHCSNGGDASAVVATFYETMEALIPVLLSSVLADHVICESNNCISPFLCHKLLMILMRISECFEARPSLALSCLNSLQKYGRGLLVFTLQASASEADSLNDSPFLASLVQGPQQARASVSLPTKHLQRQAFFILFKIACSVHHLIEPRNATQVHDDVLDPGTEEQDEGRLSVRCNLKQTVSKILIEWLERQDQLKAQLPYLTSKDCTFLDLLAKSFVYLYFEEDDLMFKMLLLLSNQPSLLNNLVRPEQPNNCARWRVAAMAFRPERIFHAFLAAIQYNPSVLIDFLISKDSGALCLQYLMRSTRCILDSWPEFVKAAPCGGINSQPPQPGDSVAEDQVNTSLACGGSQPKRQRETEQDQLEPAYQRKTGEFGVDERTSKIAKWGRSDSPHYKLKLDEWCYCLDDMNIYIKTSSVRRVANCLLQLKRSIESLNQRFLFPYNPSALLKRFEAVMETLNEFLKGPEAILDIQLPDKKKLESYSS